MKRSHTIVLGLGVSAMLTVSAAQADLLLGWDFLAAGPNASTTGNVASVNSTTNATGVDPGTITRGAGTPAYAIGWAPYGGRGAMTTSSEPWRGGIYKGWTLTTLDAAKTANAYFQWTIAPAGGYQMSLASLDLVTYQNSGAAGTSRVAVEYSLDGFATAGTSVGMVNPVHNGWLGANTNFSLAGFVNLQNTTSVVTFRAYGYGFGAYEDGGLGQIVGNNTDVGVNGTVEQVIPEPATLGLLAMGGLMILPRRR